MEENYYNSNNNNNNNSNIFNSNNNNNINASNNSISNIESTQTRFLKIKNLMQRLQGIDPNISLSGLLGDRSKDLGVFGGLLRKTLKKEALLEKDSLIFKENPLENNNRGEIIDESLNISYAAPNNEDCSFDSNASLMDSSNLMSFKKINTSFSKPTTQNLSIAAAHGANNNNSPSLTKLSFSDPVDSELIWTFIKENSQRDSIFSLLKNLVAQTLQALISQFSQPKPQKALEPTELVRKPQQIVDWSLRFAAKLEHLVDFRLSALCKTFSQGFFDLKSRFDNALLSDKRMLSFMVLTNVPFRNPIENITSRGLIAVAENDRFSFFEQTAMVSGVFEAWDPTLPNNKPGVKAAQYLYQYENLCETYSNNNSGFLNENAQIPKVLFKSPSLGYPILSLVYAKDMSSLNQLVLAVVGLYSLNVVFLDKSFNLLKKLAFENKMPQDYIIKAQFLPEAENFLAVLTLRSLKILGLHSEGSVAPVLVRFSLLDQTLFKDFTLMQHASNPKEKRIFVAANDGNLYTHVLNVEELQSFSEEDLILVENVYFPADARPANKAVSSVNFFAKSQLLFCGFEDGTTIAGKFAEKELEIINLIRLKPAEPTNLRGFEAFLQKQGQIFAQIKEIAVDEDHAKYVVLLRKGNMSFAMLLKLSSNALAYLPLLPFNAQTSIKAEGVCVLPLPEKSACLVLQPFEDGSVHMFVTLLEETGNNNNTFKALREENLVKENLPMNDKEVLKEKSKKRGEKPANKDRKGLLKDSNEIESFVREHFLIENFTATAMGAPKILVDFAERFANITPKLDPNTVSLQGDFPALLPANARNFRAIGNLLKEPPQILKSERQNIRLSLGFSSKDWVVCGLRLRIALNERHPSLKLRFFDREFVLPYDKSKPVEPLIVDLAMNEPEILYVFLHGTVEFELLGSKPVMFLLFGIDVHGCAEKDFETRKKLQALGQILRISQKPVENERSATFEGKEALLNSKVLATDLESCAKNQLLRRELRDFRALKTVNLCDLCSFFVLLARKDKDGGSFVGNLCEIEQLLELLKPLLLEEKLDKYVKTSLKRLVRALLEKNEGSEGLDYESFKDFCVLELVAEEFDNVNSLSFERALQLLQKLAKFSRKRCFHLFVLFQKHANFVRNCVGFCGTVLKSRKKDVEDAVFESFAGQVLRIVLQNYQYLRNCEKNAQSADKTSHIQELFDSFFGLFDAADLEQKAKLMRIFSDLLKTEVLNYSEEFLNAVSLVNLPRDVFAVASSKTEPLSVMEIEANAEENEEVLMKLAIEMSLKEKPEKPEKPDKSEKLWETQTKCFEISHFEVFTDIFEFSLRRIEALSAANPQDFEENAGYLFYLLRQALNLPLNYQTHKLISQSFAAKTDAFIAKLFEKVFTGLQNPATSLEKHRSLLCFASFLNNFLRFINKNLSFPAKSKASDTISSNTAYKSECRAKFLGNLRLVEGHFSSFSQLILAFLRNLHLFLTSNQGSLRFEYQNGVFQENLKRMPSERVSKYVNDKHFAENWRCIFRKSELLKRGTGVFEGLDQSLYSCLMFLFTNALLLGYKEENLAQSQSEWLSFVCKSLIMPPTHVLASTHAKKLRNLLFKDQNSYNEMFDCGIYEVKAEFLRKVYEATNKFKKPLTYDQMQFLLRTLNTLSRHSSKRPKIWSAFNEKNSLKNGLLLMLIESLQLNINEITENCLHLLAAYFTPLQLEDKTSQLLSKKSKDYEELINKIIENALNTQCQPWFKEIQRALELVGLQIFLESNVKTLRMNALKFFISLWFAGNTQEKAQLLEIMLKLSQNLHTYGNNVEHFLLFVNFLGCFLRKSEGSHENHEVLRETLTKIHWELTKCFLKLTDSLKTHKNFQLYRDLRELLADFSETTLKPKKFGYYFELNGCLKCYELMNSPYHELKLGEITETGKTNAVNPGNFSQNFHDFKFETFKYSEKKLKFNENVKFTGNSIIAKFNNTYEIDAITLVLLENYKIRKTVKSLNIYVNNKIINDILDLKNLKSEWKFAKSHNIEEKASGSRKTIKIPFTIPLTARNLKLDFFMNQTKGESLYGNCDVCGAALLEDKYLGTFCLNCKERNREKQCPCCYNIIYEKNDSIFCVPDCGYCKFFDYEIMLSVRIGSKIEKIDSVKARDDVNFFFCYK